MSSVMYHLFLLTADEDRPGFAVAGRSANATLIASLGLEAFSLTSRLGLDRLDGPVGPERGLAPSAFPEERAGTKTPRNHLRPARFSGRMR
jgi:hypothetical protein